jgi:alpha-1,6-mannosyltransferase
MSVRGPLGATPQSGVFEFGTPALDTRASQSASRAGLLGLVGLLATGLVIALASVHTDALLPESARPIPDWLAGPLSNSGVSVGHATLIACLALMFGSFVLVLRQAERLSTRTVLATIAGLHALFLLAPPLLSTDIFSYQFYARMPVLYGANPYLHGPHALALDPLYPFIGAKWVTTPSAYGPLFTALSYPVALFDIAASALAFKALAAFASIGTVALVWNGARLRGLDPVRAAILVGLNPLVVVYAVGGGHNDMLMLLGLTAGAYLMLVRRERAGGAMVVAAAGIKLTAGLLLPFAAAASRNTRRGVLIGAGAASVAVAALAFALFGAGPLNLFSTLQKSQSAGDWHSIPGFISTQLGLGSEGHAAGLVLAAMFVGVTVWLVLRVRRGELDWITGAGWATVAMLVTASSLLPWYVVWLLPLAALSPDRRLRLTAIVMTGVIQGIHLLDYVPHGKTLFGL